MHRLADILYFGVPEICSKCCGPLYFNDTTYSCFKFKAWGRCDNDVKQPKRRKPYINYSLQKIYPFLMNFKFTIRTRALHQFRLEDENGQNLIDMYGIFFIVNSFITVMMEIFKFFSRPYKNRPLFNMEFVLIGKLNATKQTIERRIQQMGGKVVTEIHEKLAAVISNEDEIKKMGPKMTLAKTCDIQVVSEDFLTQIETIDPFRYIYCRAICDWGGNVSFTESNLFFLFIFFHNDSFQLFFFTFF